MLVEKWRPAAIIFFSSVSSSHFSLSFCARALSLFFLTSLSFSWPCNSLLFSFSLYLFSALIFSPFFHPIYIFSLPPFLIPNSLHTHTHPSAVMACVQRMQSAKAQSICWDRRILLTYSSFTGYVCVCVCVHVLCLHACICVSRDRLLAYAYSVSLCAYEWACVSSVDFGCTWAHAFSSCPCWPAHTTAAIMHVPVQVEVFVLTRLLCVCCDSQPAYRNAHLLLPPPLPTCASKTLH